MANPSRKPFKDKSFFLDLKFYRHQDALVQNLKKLGAKVESFLSRDVNCVVTDKEDYKPRLETWTPATPKSFFSPSSSLNRTLSPFDTPSNTSSAANESKTTVLSRGLALVQKARQENKGTTDLYEVCNQWNIKIIHLQKLLNFIAKCKISTSKICNENQPPQRKPVQSGAIYQNLGSPFIKVEDCRGKYRPHYMQFQSLKELTDRKLYKIVQSLQSDVLKPKAMPVLMPVNGGQLSNVLVSPSVHSLTPKVMPVLMPLNVGQLSNVLVSPSINSVTPSVGTRCTRTVSIDKSQLQKSSRNQVNKLLGNSKAKNENRNTRVALAKKKVSVKKKKYCEICCCTFVSIEEHLKTDRHKRFMNDRRNFRCIERIIDQLPTVSDFLQKNMASEGVEEYCSANLLVTETVPGSAAILNEPLDLAVQNVNIENIVPLEGQQEVVAASCPSDHLSAEFPYLNVALNCNDVIAKSGHSEEIQLNVHDTTSVYNLTKLKGQQNFSLDEAKKCWNNAIEKLSCFEDHKNQVTNNIQPFGAHNTQDSRDLSFGQAQNILERQECVQGHKSPPDNTAQDSCRPHLLLEEAQKYRQDALNTLECFKGDKFLVSDVSVPACAQDLMSPSMHVNNSLTEGKTQNVASAALHQGHKSPPDNTAQDGCRPHLWLEEAQKYWQDALNTLECFKDDKFLVSDVSVPACAQDLMSPSMHVNNSLTEGKTQNVASAALHSHEALSPYNNVVQYEYGTGKSLHFSKDFHSISAPASNTGVIRKFPFTNFGFGWNTPICNDLQYAQNENTSSCTNCSSRFTDGEYDTENSCCCKDVCNNGDDQCGNILNGVTDDGSALDLSVVKPAICAPLSCLLESVEGGIAVT